MVSYFRHNDGIVHQLPTEWNVRKHMIEPMRAISGSLTAQLRFKYDFSTYPRKKVVYFC